LIENAEKIDISVYGSELNEFLKVIPAQGHSSKLDKEYQEKYFLIGEFFEKNFSIRARAEAVKKWSEENKSQRRTIF